MTEGVELINAGLKARGVRLKLVEQAGLLYARGTVTRPDGTRSQQRIPLALPAATGSLLEAETRMLDLAKAIQTAGCLPDPLPWVAVPQALASPADGPARVTVADAVAAMERDFWQGKTPSAAADRTWDRLVCETARLPSAATLTVDLLVAVASRTAPGSRSRVESCKVFKRLAKLAGLEGLERLDAIRTPYEPGERQLPDDEQLQELVSALPVGHQYSWITWAAITYGARPAEVFSLQPAGDGTARVITVKRKGKLPTWRTALALPVSPVVPDRSLPWEVSSPSQYDSATAKRWVTAWGKWLGRQAPGLQLYSLRHAWAVRSIRRNLNASLAAKCLGHSLAVHHDTYHRWLEQADVAAVAATLPVGVRWV